MTPTVDNINNVPGNNWGKLTPADLKKISTPQGFYQWLAINAAVMAATQAEVDAGIIDYKYVSPFTLTNWIGASGGITDIEGGDAFSVYGPVPGVDGGGA